MMDFSFVDDPEFIKKREAQWEKDLESTMEGSTKKRVAEFKEYYFTGQNPENLKIHPLDRLNDFPLITKESIQYVLRYYIPANITNDDRRGLHCVIAGMIFSHLDETEKLALHNGLFGEVYNPDQLFPFYIADQTELEPLRYTAEQYLMSILKLTSRACGGKITADLDFWFKKPEFLCSLLNHAIDDCYKPMGSELSKAAEDIPVNFNHLQDFWGRICRYSLRPEDVKSSPVEEEVKLFLNYFKNHIETTTLKPALTESWAYHKKEAGL